MLANYSPAGKLLWGNRLGGPGEDMAHDVAVDPSGGVYITGSFSQTAMFKGTPYPSAGNRDGFLIKLAP